MSPRILMLDAFKTLLKTKKLNMKIGSDLVNLALPENHLNVCQVLFKYFGLLICNGITHYGTLIKKNIKKRCASKINF